VRIVGGVLKAIISVVMIGAVILAGIFIYGWAAPLLGGNNPCKDKGKDPVVFVVSPGESVSQVADDLQKSCIIDNAITFRLRVSMLNAGNKIQAGSFSLIPGSDYDTLINQLATSKTVPTTKITVIEGLRLEEIAEKLGNEGVVSPTSFLSKTTTPEGSAVYSDTFIATSGKPADKGLEGFLFPDTYEIKRTGGDDSDTVIRTMLDTMEQRITPEMRAAISQRQIDGQPANVYQILTLASIIQREGVFQDELADISSVYWNRLAQGYKDGFTVLNADPTSQYANGKPGQWWPELTVDQLHIKGPYNTYDNRGLPPGPICNPSLAAIQAAISPNDTQYLYFVAKGNTGRHAFAKTLEEQERNRIIYGNTK
jgi:UPF0755 protein